MAMRYQGIWFVAKMNNTPASVLVKYKFLFVIVSCFLLLPSQAESVCYEKFSFRAMVKELKRASQKDVRQTQEDGTAAVVPEKSSNSKKSSDNETVFPFLNLPDDLIEDWIAPYLFEETPFLLNLNKKLRADLCKTKILPNYLAQKYRIPLFEELHLDESFLRIEQEYIQSKISLEDSRGLSYLTKRVQDSLQPSDSTDKFIMSIVYFGVEAREGFLFSGSDDFTKYVWNLILKEGGLKLITDTIFLFSKWSELFEYHPNLPNLIEKWFAEERSTLFYLFFRYQMYRFDRFLIEFLKSPSTFIPETLSLRETKAFFYHLCRKALPDFYIRAHSHYAVPTALIYSKFGPYVAAHQSEIDPESLHIFNFRYNLAFEVPGTLTEEETCLLVAAGRYEDAFKFFEETEPKYIGTLFLDDFPDFCMKLIDRISPELYRKFFLDNIPRSFYTNPEAVPRILKVKKAASVSDLIRNLERSYLHQFDSENWAQFFMTSCSLEDFKVFVEKNDSSAAIFIGIVSLHKGKHVDEYMHFLKVFESVTLQQERKCRLRKYHFDLSDLMNRPDVLKFIASSPIFEYNYCDLLEIKYSDKYENAPEESQRIIRDLMRA